MPRVLVLLATYNGGNWLSEQLNSIFLQEDVEVQLLIADDASTDGTLQLLEEGWADDPRVVVVRRHKASGSAGANFRNLYIEANVTGFDYVALSDQDDIWLPRKLIEAVHAMKHSDSCGYSCSVTAFWPDGREYILNQDPRIKSADFLFEGGGQGCTFVVRADWFVRIQEFCLKYRSEVDALHYHDWLIYLLFRAWGAAWFFDGRPWLRYRQHGQNEIGARGSFNAIKRRLSMIRNGWYFEQVQAAISLYNLAGGADIEVAEIAQVFRATDQSVLAVRNLRLAYLILRSGRRRLADRLVLSMLVGTGLY
jgi:rhamnosyltransferase